jgi:hypothetical protein
MRKRYPNRSASSNGSVIIPFKKNKAVADLRTHLDGPVLLGKLATHLQAIEDIEKELEDSVHDQVYESIDPETGEVNQVAYSSTKLDKETIAVYHTRMNARKLQIDTTLKMLNKVMPDLKAIETTDDIANATERALRAFATAASEE